MCHGLMNTWEREYKKGFIPYVVLLLLKEKPDYGYDLYKELAGRITLQISGIYHTLNRLEKRGLITSQWKQSERGPRRKLYSITGKGEDLVRKFTFKSILPILDYVNDLIKTHFPQEDMRREGETNEA